MSLASAGASAVGTIIALDPCLPLASCFTCKCSVDAPDFSQSVNLGQLSGIKACM